MHLAGLTGAGRTADHTDAQTRTSKGTTKIWKTNLEKCARRPLSGHPLIKIASHNLRSTFGGHKLTTLSTLTCIPHDLIEIKSRDEMTQIKTP